MIGRSSVRPEGLHRDVRVLPACVAMMVMYVLPVATAVASDADDLHASFDQILELNVRDGFVYYRALQLERGRLDRYVKALEVLPAVFDRWTRDEKAAFWLDAYNALVLRTVIDNYPIRGQAGGYPAGSIRQIPGAFEKTVHRVAGRRVTLDDIEKTILPEFRDPRLYFALGRGAAGSGRLRSEANLGATLESQLRQVADEVVTRFDLIRIDRAGRQVTVSPIVGWHEAEFIATYADKAVSRFSARSAIERAIVVFVEPYLFPTEREFFGNNEFRVRYGEFDWRLNDLTGGRQ